ncbi:Ccc1 family [Xylaria nigripes]|nr:Ccc1 family [Xylaria nigripes]
MDVVMRRLPSWNGRRGTGGYSSFSTPSPTPTDAVSVRSESTDVNDLELPVAHPSLSRFFANFTLGFADGLTVPFALTAGLSSLGETNTVIYAGLAEICAGCISMGIGGYLAAKGEEKRDGSGLRDDMEKTASYVPLCRDSDIKHYLAPLQLPPDLLQSVMTHIESVPDTVERIRDNLRHAGNEPIPEPVKSSPLLAGLTVALGYLLGGLIPLSPYLLVRSVTSGLYWSFGLCIVALFVFGFVKEYALHLESITTSWNSMTFRHRLLRWKFIKQGIWEGIIMAALGGFAAITAVVCVNLFEGIV